MNKNELDSESVDKYKIIPWKHLYQISEQFIQKFDFFEYKTIDDYTKRLEEFTQIYPF